MKRPSDPLLAALVMLLLPACTALHGGPPADSPYPSRPLESSVVARMASIVGPELERLAGADIADWQVSGEPVKAAAAQFKRRLVLHALKQPWEGLANLEHQGHLLAKLARGEAANLPAVLDVLGAGIEAASSFQAPVPLPLNGSLDDLIAFMVQSLDQASRHREKAFANLTGTDRSFLFAHARSLAERYQPQISPSTETMMAPIRADVRFAQLLEQGLNFGEMLAASETLARLADESWLHRLAAVATKPLPAARVPQGITGDVVLVRETAHGLIIVGGPGPNTYESDQRVCLLIDLGGNDRYRGLIAASTDEENGHSVVIDLNGDDVYEGAPFGLATGRLGVGLLIDHAGNDVYKLSMGSGGTGFGGIGILFDAKGHDIYQGDRLTLGAALGGIGLLFDGEGHDRYTIPGFGIGFGGPLGTGAVIDAGGDDVYECGGRYASAYNAHDAPNGKPEDPLFQYDCFGLGTGSGQRIFSKRPEWQAQSLAGGVGLLLDIDGRDHYDSANFSQGHGYFFGAGMKLDLSGDDNHQAARYGHGSSAHFGVGLFLDQDGDDRYDSTGPFYNAGVAWDRSVSLMIDAGKGQDTYAFGRSTGLAQADYGGWGLFIDEAGPDRYETQLGFGRTAEKGVAGFFDLEGSDSYVLFNHDSVTSESSPNNGASLRHSGGGIFVDR